MTEKECLGHYPKSLQLKCKSCNDEYKCWYLTKQKEETKV